MNKYRKWINEYIKDIDLSNIEWVRLNSFELESFYEDNYFDKNLWEYVSDKRESVIYSPIGLKYLSLDCYSDKYNYLLGIVDNNIGKKTIVSVMVYMDNYFAFEEQEVPLTYISFVETNLYFLNRGIYSKLCNEVIKFINSNQHILITSESSMGREYGVIDRLRNILIKNGFEERLFVDDGFNCLDIDFYNSVMCKKRKIR